MHMHQHTKNACAALAVCKTTKGHGRLVTRAVLLQFESYLLIYITCVATQQRAGNTWPDVRTC